MKPQLPSRLPAVIDALLALLAAAEPLAGVQILDGPPLRMADLEDDTIAVAPGFEFQPGAVSTFESQNALGRASYVERIEVGMTAASYSGEVNLKARRDRVAALLAAVKAVIDANQVRAGAWDGAELGPTIEWYPKQEESGTTVEVGFTLVFKAIL
jgi:hypothetical protein